MGFDVSVVCGTYGDAEWQHLARTRAWPSVVAQGVPWHHIHGTSLADARNRALELVDTEWVIHLDADDQLEDQYVDAMSKGTADLRAPAVRYVEGPDKLRGAKVPKVVNHSHQCEAECLLEGNWLVIGTALRADMLRDVGGWRDFTWSEDWDVFLRCYLAGATVEAIPEAVYRAWVREDSRNRAPNRAARLAAHEAIAAANQIAA